MFSCAQSKIIADQCPAFFYIYSFISYLCRSKTRPRLTAVLAYGFANNAHRPPEYIDADGDGKPDVLRSYWHGRYITWIDDNGNLKKGDVIGDFVDDCMLVDCDGDEIIDNNLPGRGVYYPDPGKKQAIPDPFDYMIDWVDTDKDGKWDVVRTHCKWKEGFYHYPFAMEHFRIDKKADDLNVVNWDTFAPHPRQDYDRRGYGFGYETIWGRFNDATIYLQNHPEMPHEVFYGYDVDNDHIPEIRLRTGDKQYSPEPPVGEIDYADLSVDIFERSNPHNRCDWNFMLRFSSVFDFGHIAADSFLKKGGDWDFLHKRLSLGSKPALSYRDCVADFPAFSGNRAGDKFISAEVSLPFRSSYRRCFLPHNKALKKVLGHEWRACSMTWDENDDDHAPEGMFGDCLGNSYGDRFEVDPAYKGKGSFYIGPFDGKIHLYGAAGGIWRIDESGRLMNSGSLLARLLYCCPWSGYYWDADQKQKIVTDGKRAPLIRYTDRDGDGFIDYIEFDMDADGRFERKLSLPALNKDYLRSLEKREIFRFEADNYQSVQKLFLSSIERRYGLLVELVKRLRKTGLPVAVKDTWLDLGDVSAQYREMFWLQEACALSLRQAGRKDMLMLEQMLYLGDLEKAIDKLPR